MTSATIEHPLVDAAGLGWAETRTRAAVIALTVGMADFLHRVSVAGDRPIVVSDPHARMTQPLVHALADIGGHWVVRTDDDGLYDARTGAHLTAAHEVLGLGRHPSRHGVHPAFLRVPIASRLQLVLTVATRHRVSRPVRLGGVAETALELLAGARPSAWGATEPLVAPWDRDQLTEYSRRRMPHDSRWALVGGAPQHAIATLDVARTTEGLEETSRLWIDVAGAGDPRAAGLAGEARQALARTAENGMPLLGVALAHVGPPDLTRRALAEPPPQPLALLIGPPGVRGLGIEPRRWVDELGAALIGSPRLPGVLLTLGSVDGGGWERLGEVLGAADPDRVGELLSLAPIVAAQLREGGPL